jgi:hypothetical protein
MLLSNTDLEGKNRKQYARFFKQGHPTGDKSVNVESDEQKTNEFKKMLRNIKDDEENK